ncbi:unnamed protein product, partial [Iphiclides podalirius]
MSHTNTTTEHRSQLRNAVGTCYPLGGLSVTRGVFRSPAAAGYQFASRDSRAGSRRRPLGAPLSTAVARSAVAA